MPSGWCARPGADLVRGGADPARAGGARVKHERMIPMLSPEEVAALPDASFEVVIMHSVSQYLSPTELDASAGAVPPAAAARTASL